LGGLGVAAFGFRGFAVPCPLTRVVELADEVGAEVGRAAVTRDGSDVGRTVAGGTATTAGGALVGATARRDLVDSWEPAVGAMVRLVVGRDVAEGATLRDPATLRRSTGGFDGTRRTSSAPRPGTIRCSPGTLTWLCSVRATAAPSSTTAARKIRLPHVIADRRVPEVSLNTGLSTNDPSSISTVTHRSISPKYRRAEITKWHRTAEIADRPVVAP
jgi:hypothetical protein